MIVNWTDFAKARLHQIHQYIAEDSPKVADQTIKRIVDRSTQISKLPKSQSPDVKSRNTNNPTSGKY